MKREILAAVVLATLMLMVSSVGLAVDEPEDNAFGKSVALEYKGKYQDALNALAGVPADMKSAYVTHLRRGWLLYNLGRYEDSVKEYKAAVAKEPGSVEAAVGIISPQLALRRWVDAEKSAKAALKLDPKNYLAQSKLAYAYFNLTRFHESEKLYLEILSRYPSDLEMRSGYAWSIFKQGRYEEAKAEFKKVLAVSPKYATALQGIKLCP